MIIIIINILMEWDVIKHAKMQKEKLDRMDIFTPAPPETQLQRVCSYRGVQEES